MAAGLTTYQKAHLVFMLPHSVITVSIVTAMLPALSRIAHDGNLAQVGADVAATMRMVGALIVPVAAILIVNGASVAILLFGYGAATPEQAGLMGLIVSVFMLGLLPFTLFYVLLRGYYALEDTRTPILAHGGVQRRLLLSSCSRCSTWPLRGGNQVAAIALAYAVAYWIGFVITWWVLARRLGCDGIAADRLVAGTHADRRQCSRCRLMLAVPAAAPGHLETGGIAATSTGVLLLSTSRSPPSSGWSATSPRRDSYACARCPTYSRWPAAWSPANEARMRATEQTRPLSTPRPRDPGSGAGDGAEVYLWHAYDEVLDRDVAIRVLATRRPAQRRRPRVPPRQRRASTTGACCACSTSSTCRRRRPIQPASRS